MVKFCCLFFCLLFLTACESGTDPNRSFFFPVDRFVKEPTIYRYHHPTNDSIAPEIWLFEGVQSDSGLFLESTLFNEREGILQTSSDKMADNGSLLRQIALFFADSTGKTTPVKGEVLEPAGFLFSEYKPRELTLLKIRFKLSDDPEHLITLTRGRQFRRDTTFHVLGRTFAAKAFDLTEHVDDDQNGHLELTYPGYEVFAEGLGRVYYKKSINSGYSIEFYLRDTMSLTTYKRQYGDQIPLRPKNE